MYGAFWVIDPMQTKTRVGTIQYIDQDGGWWGIETSRTFLGIPVKKERLSFSDTSAIYELPNEFKKVGLPVKIRYEIVDVIGMSDWDIYIVPSTIEKISG